MQKNSQNQSNNNIKGQLMLNGNTYKGYNHPAGNFSRNHRSQSQDYNSMLFQKVINSENKIKSIADIKFRYLMYNTNTSTSNKKEIERPSPLNVLYNPLISDKMKEKYSIIFNETLNKNQAVKNYEENTDIKNFFKNKERVNGKNKAIKNKRDEILSMLMNKDAFEKFSFNQKMKGNNKETQDVEKNISSQRVRLFNKHLEKIFQNNNTQRPQLSSETIYFNIMNKIKSNNTHKVSKTNEVEEFEKEFKKEF